MKKPAQIFLDLPNQTVPCGYEMTMYHDLLTKHGFELKDTHYILKIGNPDTAIIAHLDDVSKNSTKINHILEGGMVKTDGKTILGADDRAGISLILYMVSNKVNGCYILYTGEECGLIGSSEHAAKWDLPEIRKAISLDRAGKVDVITHQSHERTCSDEFADGLIAMLGMGHKRCELGSFTDSYSLRGVASECTNLAVGYKYQHTVKETQDLKYLDELGEALIKCDFNSLPTTRTPVKEDKWDYRGYSKTPVL